MNIIPEHGFGEVERNFYMTKLSVTSGNTDDLERLWLQFETSSSLTDIQSLWLLFLRGKASSQSDNLRDNWSEYLTAQGFDGNIIDMTSAYFIANS